MLDVQGQIRSISIGEIQMVMQVSLIEANQGEI